MNYNFFLSGVLLSTILKSLIEHKSLKVNLVVECNFSNMKEEFSNRAFKTKNEPIFEDTNVNEYLENSFKKLIKEMEEAQLKNSGWSLLGVDGVRLKINKYNPLRGSTYIPLPEIIANKKACINVENKDEKCFMYSILAKFIDKNAQRVTKYKHLENKYDFNMISYPTSLKDIQNFEKNNNISINIFGLEKKEQSVYPLKIVLEEKEDHRDLLLLKNENNTNHYVYIKHFEKLVQCQLSKRGHSITICKRCLTHFDNQGGKTAQLKLAEHKEWCNEKDAVRVEMPTKKPFVEFENVQKVMRVPFVVYCDFESILKPVEGCKPSYDEVYTTPFQHHEEMSFCAYLKKSDDIYGNSKDLAELLDALPKEPYLYRGPNASEHLLLYLGKIAEKVSKIYSLKKSMIKLTDEENELFDKSEKCYMCDKFFKDKNEKVRDHCHITGKYRGVAHKKCNIKYQVPNFLPILFHNLSGYDSHHIITKLGYDSKQIDVIPNTEEKYISFSKSINENIKLRFLDTFRFMPSSIDALAKNLTNIREIPKFFAEKSVNLLKRKGVFPYDYITSWEKLSETNLPKQKDFYNQLTMHHISDEDYQHAQNIWNAFEIKNLGEYSDLYLKTDVLLLADIFENFRDITMKTHKLDPCQYYTLPGLSWDSMLRYTEVRLELLQDYDMILMVDRGIRGGICQVSHRYIKANNKYTDEYDENEKSTFISYQDCTNLYGHAMSQPLPVDSFEWVDTEGFHLENITKDSEFGYILDVDIEYPSELHKLHDSLPFMAEVIEIDQQRKLVPHLNGRKNYVIHYLALQQALTHGLILLRNNKILKFRQSAWLKPYIDFNTELRKNATNDFEKDIYKLKNNAVFGKTMENIRKRLNMKLVTGSKRIEKLISKPEFIDRTIYSENLAAVHLSKKSILFDKPIYVGMSILDLSKCVMYEYHYDVMLKKYGLDRIKLAYMDTDSFIYEIQTDDIFVDISKMLDYMDTSDYPKDHMCYSIKNKKVPGTFKDEANGNIISKYIGLRAKMYAIQLKGKVIKKAKGLQSAVVKKCIDFDDYEDCLFNSTIIRMPMNQIRSKKHVMSSIEVNKLALSPFDNKRIILDDRISTRSIGYSYNINNRH